MRVCDWCKKEDREPPHHLVTVELKLTGAGVPSVVARNFFNRPTGELCGDCQKALIEEVEMAVSEVRHKMLVKL